MCTTPWSTSERQTKPLGVPVAASKRPPPRAVCSAATSPNLLCETLRRCIQLYIRGTERASRLPISRYRRQSPTRMEHQTRSCFEAPIFTLNYPTATSVFNLLAARRRGALFFLNCLTNGILSFC